MDEKERQSAVLFSPILSYIGGCYSSTVYRRKGLPLLFASLRLLLFLQASPFSSRRKGSKKRGSAIQLSHKCLLPPTPSSMAAKGSEDEDEGKLECRFLRKNLHLPMQYSCG